MILLIIPLGIAIGLLIIRATSLGKSEAQGGFASHGDRVLIITAHPDDETMVSKIQRRQDDTVPKEESAREAATPASARCLRRGVHRSPWSNRHGASSVTQFFSPTILSLAWSRISTSILCLSNGKLMAGGRMRH